MYYKNIDTGYIGFFAGIPDENWILATAEEIKQSNLSDLKRKKASELKAARDSLLSGSQVYTIKVDGKDCAFSLSNADLAVLLARRISLTNNEETIDWNNTNNDRIALNKAAVEGLIRHINSNDENTWTLYTSKRKELNTLMALEGVNIEDIKNFNTNLI